MGGKGSGGARTGTGPKPKGAALLSLHASRFDRVPHDVPLPAAVEPVAVEMPADMPEDQQAVWTSLAPFALEQRTLIPATAGSFRDLCAAIVVRDRILAKIDEDGWTFLKISVDGAGVEHQELKRHPLTSEYRGWEQRVEAGRARFKLAPMGKSIAPEPKPQELSPLEKLQQQAKQMKRG
jgi:hypothetical protein